MTYEEFDQEFKSFLNEFNKSFDTPQNQAAIKSVVNAQASEEDPEYALYYEHVYQQQRTDNLVKLAISHFLKND